MYRTKHMKSKVQVSNYTCHLQKRKTNLFQVLVLCCCLAKLIRIKLAFFYFIYYSLSKFFEFNLYFIYSILRHVLVISNQIRPRFTNNEYFLWCKCKIVTNSCPVILDIIIALFLFIKTINFPIAKG